MKYQIQIRSIKDFLNDNIYLTNINMQRKYIYNHTLCDFFVYFKYLC